MTTATAKTFSPRARDIERAWYVVDADGAVLGRLASEVAKILRGKHKPIFAPHADTGDHVIVINAKGVRLTGGKEEKKIYYRHSGYPGGLTETNYTRLLAERPVLAVEKAIRGMLPKNRLGRAMFKKLSVYPGDEHTHQAQKPVPLALGEVPRWTGLPKPAPATPKPEKAPQDRPRRGRAGRGEAPAGKGGSTLRGAARARPTAAGRTTRSVKTTAGATAAKAQAEAADEPKATETKAAKPKASTAKAPRAKAAGAEVADTTPAEPKAGRTRRSRKAKPEDSKE